MKYSFNEGSNYMQFCKEGNLIASLISLMNRLQMQGSLLFLFEFLDTRNTLFMLYIGTL